MIIIIYIESSINSLLLVTKSEVKMRLCDSCGSPKPSISMGGASICKECDYQVRTEMDKLRADGKPVNVLHIAKRLFHEANDAGNYLLRDIPQALWDQVKHRALDDGISLRDLILQSLHLYLDRQPPK